MLYTFFLDEYFFNDKVRYLFNIDNENKNYFVLRRIANINNGDKTKRDVLYFCFFVLAGSFLIVI